MHSKSWIRGVVFLVSASLVGCASELDPADDGDDADEQVSSQSDAIIAGTRGGACTKRPVVCVTSTSCDCRKREAEALASYYSCELNKCTTDRCRTSWQIGVLQAKLVLMDLTLNCK